MRSLSVCETKQAHDTEFEATIIAAKMEHKYEEEFLVYECGSHWHVAHVDPVKRLGAGHGYARCPHCKRLFRRSKMYKHKCKVKETLHGTTEETHPGTGVTAPVQAHGIESAASRVLPLGQPSEQIEIEGF